MKPEAQIKALAELDGRMAKEIKPYAYAICEGQYGSFNGDQCLWVLPCYLHSYDAIIPLIQKQPDDVKSEIVEVLYEMGDRQLDRSPAQLCEALLRATGKWKD